MKAMLVPGSPESARVQFVTSITANTRTDIDMITGRINYHFNWGNPVVARY
jgi:hypothetical protein